MRKQDVETKEDVIAYYNQVRKIFFKEGVEVKSMQELLGHTLNIDRNKRLATFYSRGGVHCVDTRYRSLDDIIKFSVYYFPGITIGDILVEIMLYEDLKVLDKVKVNYGYCPNIRKYNFRPYVFGYGRYDSFKEGLDDVYPVYLTTGLGFPNSHIRLRDFL